MLFTLLNGEVALQADYSWQDDPDITEDWTLMLKLRTNLDEACQGRSPVQPRSADTGCFFI